MRMKYPTSMNCINNWEVDKDLQSNIDNVPFEENRKTLKKVFFKEKSIKEVAGIAYLQNLIADINENKRV